MSSLARQLAIVLARVGKVCGLVMRPKRGKGRSSTPVLGVRFSSWWELSAVSAETLECNGHLGTLLAAGDTLLDRNLISPRWIEPFLVKRAALLSWKQKQIDEMRTGVCGLRRCIRE